MTLKVISPPLSPKSLGFGWRAFSTGKWGPCWAVTFPRVAAMDIQIDLAVSLTTLVCALQRIWSRNKRKEKCYQIWRLSSGRLSFALFWWENHTVLLFSLNNSFPLFPVTDWLCCSVCRVTKAHCGPRPQSYAQSSSREVSDMEIACPGHRKQPARVICPMLCLSPCHV